MKKSIVFLFLTILIFSCSEEPKGSLNENEKPIPKEKVNDLKSFVKESIEAQLQIPANEKYTLNIQEQNLNLDNIPDAIITVNRYEYALKKASSTPNAAKQAEIGFIGNYNYIFFYDGAKESMSVPEVIPSSPMLSLNVKFDNITSPQFVDAIITYRIRNSAYNAFYTIENGALKRYFEWPLFDGLGNSNATAFSFGFSPPTSSPRKNIQIFEGKIVLSDTTTLFNTATPIIKPTKKLLYEFFYLPAKNTYVTKK